MMQFVSKDKRVCCGCFQPCDSCIGYWYILDVDGQIFKEFFYEIVLLFSMVKIRWENDKCWLSYWSTSYPAQFRINQKGIIIIGIVLKWWHL